MKRIFVFVLALGLLAAWGMTAPSLAADKCIDVEKASAKNLEKLKGVGPALAKKIVDHRKAMRIKATKAKKKIWNFQNWKTLMKVPGVGPKLCADNLKTLCFNGKRQKACPAPDKKPLKK